MVRPKIEYWRRRGAGREGSREGPPAPSGRVLLPERLAAAARDLTGRDPALVALAETRARLEHVLRASPVVTYTLAVRDGRFVPTWISGNIAGIMGYTPLEAVGPTWWAGGLHPDDREAVIGFADDLIRRGTILHTYRFRHADGSYRWIEDRMRLLPDESGAPLEVVGSWTDVTEKRTIEMAFLEAQKLETVGRFAATIAHDFGNVLGVLQGYAALLRDEIAPGDPGREEVEEITKAAEEGARLMRMLVGSGHERLLQFEFVDVGVVLRGMRGMIERMAGGSVRVTFGVHEGPMQVASDLGRMENIVLHLVTNALAAMPDGGTLTIEARPEEADAGDGFQARRGVCPVLPQARLTVADTGVGMDGATLDRIFEPFFTTRAHGAGAGLGLTTVQTLVQELYGCVCVRSEPGAGSAFEVRLPLVA